MKILFHLGHPAHYHLFKNVITNLKKEGHLIYILIKKKDVLENLLISSGFEYQNILPGGRKDGKISIAIGLIKQMWKIFSFSLMNKPHILIGTSASISHVGKILKIPTLIVGEDDAEAVPLLAKVAYPLASEIITPIVCDNLKWNNKSTKYNSYHELAYLHPNHFKPDFSVVRKYFPENSDFFLLRFAKLNAHHDEGIKGINKEIAIKLIETLQPFGKVIITSERKLESELEQYRMYINPEDMHHIMAFAKLYIGDSQTMAAEAGVLGIPFIRFNDFVGRIGYLDELENKYNLGFGFKTNEIEKLFNTLQEILKTTNLKEIFQERRKKMLSEKIDFSKFLTWYIGNYPESSLLMKENSDIQYNYK